jgi:hypothetical protein
MWYTTSDPEIDYKTGDKTNYSFHPKSLSDAETKELDKLISMSRNEFHLADPNK